MFTKPHLLGVAGALSVALVGLTTTPAHAATNWNWDTGGQVGSATGSIGTGNTAILTCFDTTKPMDEQVGMVHTSTGVPCSSVRSIGVRLDSGNVNLSYMQSSAFPSLTSTTVSAEKVTGSFADDTLIGAPGTEARLAGGAGDDILVNGGVAWGGDGDDIIEYGAEDFSMHGVGEVHATTADALNALQRAQDVHTTIDGGDGRDRLWFQLTDLTKEAFTLTDGTVLLTSDQWSMVAPQPIASIENFYVLNPTNGASINATASTVPVWVNGEDGNAVSVTVRGGSGNDRIVGVAGVLSGGAGADRIEATGSTGSTLVGGPGKDTLTGDLTADTIHARDGEVDTIDCSEGTDTAYVDAIDVVKNCEVLNPAPRTGRVTGKARIYQRTHHAKRIVRVALPAIAAGQRLQCRLDKRKWVPCANNFVLRPRALKKGRHVLAVRAAIYDLLDPTPSTYRFKVKR